MRQVNHYENFFLQHVKKSSQKEQKTQRNRKDKTCKRNSNGRKRKTKNIIRKTRRLRKTGLSRKTTRERLGKLEIEIEKIENQEYLETAIDTVNEKQKVEIIREVRITKETKTKNTRKSRKTKKTRKARKAKTKKAERANKLEAETESIERLELANNSNAELRIESKKLLLVLQNISAMEKNLRIKPIDSSLKTNAQLLFLNYFFNIIYYLEY